MSSKVVMVVLAPDGASLTALTVIATVSESVSGPPLPVLPWSEVTMLKVSAPA
ncbi:hypothetical protein AQB9606_04660 [Aquabacterium sp. CECT 9606]|nr:hypothetical protein AQB9606_04660 [Aquabacterium sp. CECT 9606]